MNILSTGLACQYHELEKNEKAGKVDSCIEEKKLKRMEEDHRINGIMEFLEEEDEYEYEEEEEEEEGENYGKVEFQIWPVEHPMEPQDEDRPVKCPMPESSVINVNKFSKNEEGKRERKLAESLRKRSEENTESRAENFCTDRTVRKRHHTLTGGDDHIVVIHPLPTPPQSHNLNIFQMLHQFD